MSNFLIKNEKYNIQTMNLIDLCAGTGAFSLAFEKIGSTIVFANDFDKFSKLAYNINFKSHNFSTININDIDVKQLPKHNIICAGFPCQSFSLAGKN